MTRVAPTRRHSQIKIEFLNQERRNIRLWVHHHVTYIAQILPRHVGFSESMKLIYGQFRQTQTLTIRDPVLSDYIHEA